MIDVVYVSDGKQDKRMDFSAKCIERHLLSDKKIRKHRVNTGNVYFERYRIIRELMLAGSERILYLDNDTYLTQDLDIMRLPAGIYALNENKHFTQDYHNSGAVYYNLVDASVMGRLQVVYMFQKNIARAIGYFRSVYPEVTPLDVIDQFQDHIACDQPCFNLAFKGLITTAPDWLFTTLCIPYDNAGIVHYWTAKYDNKLLDYVNKLMEDYK